MSNNTELFCVLDDFFLKFEANYWKFIKHSPRYPRTWQGNLLPFRNYLYLHLVHMLSM